MNILTEALPDAVAIGDQVVAIDPDWRAALRVICAFEDPDLTPAEKAAVLLDNLYPEPPADLEAALAQGVRFLNGGADGGAAADGPRLYSFQRDAALIFAAFRQTHGIDLATVEGLHWWAFLALFADLGADTAFCGLVSLRKRVKSGKATKEERRLYRELEAQAELPEPDTRSEADRARYDEFMRLVEEGKARRAAAQE